MTHWTDTISTDWHRARQWTGRIRGRLADYAGTLTTWRQRAVERRQLLALDGRILKDIGISRVDAVNEASKPFWRK